MVIVLDKEQRFMAKITLLTEVEQQSEIDMFDHIATRHFVTYGNSLSKEIEAWVYEVNRYITALPENFGVLVEVWSDEPVYERNGRFFSMDVTQRQSVATVLNNAIQAARQDIMKGELIQ